MTVKKHLRAQEIAQQNRLPCIYLVDSGGANLPQPGRGVPRPRALRPHLLQPGEHVGAQGIPQIAVVMGSCTAGGAYVPAMSDETIIVQEPGHDLPRRPAAGEGGDRRGRQRRGARRRRRAHARSPASPTTARRTTRTRSRIARRIVANLNRSKTRDAATARAARAAATTAEELYGVIPTDTRKPYDVREVIARIVDGSRARRVQGALRHDAGHRLRAHLRAMPVGIIANNGILFSESALKGAHFIELCCQREIPLRVPAEHHRLHGRPQVRGRRHRQATAPRW